MIETWDGVLTIRLTDGEIIALANGAIPDTVRDCIVEAARNLIRRPPKQESKT